MQKMFSMIPVFVFLAFYGKLYFTETVIEMDSLKEAKGILARQGVNPESCLDWAFGVNWENIETKRINDVWASRHSEIFKFHSTDEKNVVFKKIAQECRGNGDD